MSLLRVTLPKPRAHWWTIVSGEPVSKERARVMRGGWSFTPKKTVAGEKDFAWAIKAAHPNLKCNAVDTFGIRCIFHCTPGTRRRSHTMPDADNLLKLCKDALKTVAWDNDRQVLEDYARVVPVGTDAPRTEVLFYVLDEAYLRERDRELA